MEKNSVNQLDKVQLQQQIIYFKAELVKYMKQVQKFEQNYQVSKMKELEKKYNDTLEKNSLLEKNCRSLVKEKQTWKNQLTEKNNVLEKMKEHLQDCQLEIEGLQNKEGKWNKEKKSYIKELEDLKKNSNQQQLGELEKKYNDISTKNNVLEKRNQSLVQEEQTWKSQLAEKDSLLEKKNGQFQELQLDLENLQKKELQWNKEKGSYIKELEDLKVSISTNEQQLEEEVEEKEEQETKNQIFPNVNHSFSDNISSSKKYDQFFQTYQASFREKKEDDSNEEKE